MMHMNLYWGKGVPLLIDSWKPDSWISYNVTLLACFLFSSFYQYMEVRCLGFGSLASSTPSQPSPAGPKHQHSAELVAAVVFGFNMAIGYLLMLVITSFNGGVFLAVISGLAVGYLLFKFTNENPSMVDNVGACA